MPKSYQNIAGTVLATVKDLKVLKPSDIISPLVEEEQRRTANSTQLHRVSHTTALPQKCAKCGRTNHTTDNCYAKTTVKDNKGNNSGSGNKAQGQSQQGKGKGKNRQQNAQIKNLSVDQSSVPSVDSENSVSVSLYTVRRDKSLWLMDSGCTAHATPYKTDFVKYTPFPNPGRAILAGGSHSLQILGRGTVVIRHTTTYNIPAVAASRSPFKCMMRAGSKR